MRDIAFHVNVTIPVHFRVLFNRFPVEFLIHCRLFTMSTWVQLSRLVSTGARIPGSLSGVKRRRRRIRRRRISRRRRAKRRRRIRRRRIRRRRKRTTTAEDLKCTERQTIRIVTVLSRLRQPKKSTFKLPIHLKCMHGRINP
jgi:hypothetical protein